MAAPALSQIEEQFVHLPREEQLILLERLVHQLRLGAAGNGSFRNPQPPAVPSDPVIRHELNGARVDFIAAGSDLLSEAW
jgi:hypothetical protein